MLQQVLPAFLNASHSPCCTLPVHETLPAQGRPSDKAIPVGATGLLVTCDSGREFKAYDEMMRLLEEVRGEGGEVQWWGEGVGIEPGRGRGGGGGGVWDARLGELKCTAVSDYGGAEASLYEDGGGLCRMCGQCVAARGGGVNRAGVIWLCCAVVQGAMQGL